MAKFRNRSFIRNSHCFNNKTMKNNSLSMIKGAISNVAKSLNSETLDLYLDLLTSDEIKDFMDKMYFDLSSCLGDVFTCIYKNIILLSSDSENDINLCLSAICDEVGDNNFGMSKEDFNRLVKCYSSVLYSNADTVLIDKTITFSLCSHYIRILMSTVSDPLCDILKRITIEYTESFMDKLDECGLLIKDFSADITSYTICITNQFMEVLKDFSGYFLLEYFEAKVGYFYAFYDKLLGVSSSPSVIQHRELSNVFEDILIDLNELNSNKKVYTYIDNYKSLNSLAETNGFIYSRSNGDHGIFKHPNGSVVVIPQGRLIGKGLSFKIQKLIDSALQ